MIQSPSVSLRFIQISTDSHRFARISAKLTDLGGMGNSGQKGKRAKTALGVAVWLMASYGGLGACTALVTSFGELAM